MNRSRFGVGVAVGLSAVIGCYITQRTENAEYLKFVNESATVSVSVAKKMLTSGGEAVVATAGVVGDAVSTALGMKGGGAKLTDSIASGTYTLFATVGVFLGIALYQKIH